MAEHSTIEWTDATWNPVTGCSIVSPGCANCYAMKLAGTRLKHHPSRAGLTVDSKNGPVWNGKVRLNEQWLDQPLRWRRPRMIFVCAHGDLFHEDVPDEWIDRVFAVMALSPQHTFQVLTKRSARMRAYMNGIPSKIPFLGRMPLERIHLEAAGHMEGDGGFMDALKERGNVYSLYLDAPWPLPNVWLGVSVERQKEADERIPDLLATPAAIRFLSAEPLLGRINIHDAMWAGDPLVAIGEALDWVIAGGESGDRANPMHPDWARALRDQCAATDTPFFFKQWGSWAPHKPTAGGNLGGDVRAGRVRIVHPTGRTDAEITETSGGRSTERGSRYMEHVTKKVAGRLLDGVEHNGMPQPREVPAL